MIKKTQYIGIIFAVVIGVSAHLLAENLIDINGILLGLFIGIIWGNTMGLKENLQEGVTFSASKMLEFSIIFLAFGVNYNHVSKMGWNLFLVLLLVVFMVLLTTVFLSKKFNCPSGVGWLVGFGTAICGSSAIAALAPSIQKEKEDVGVAMAVVNFYGTLGMLILPLILVVFGANVLESSYMIGGSLHSVGNVAGAAFGISTEIGEDALTIKLARVAMLSPGLLFFNFLVNRNSKQHWLSYFKLPWYLWAFLLITILVSVIELPIYLLNWTQSMGKIVLTIGMFAIGLKMKFATMFSAGKRGLLFGLVIFIIQLIFLSLGLQLIN